MTSTFRFKKFLSLVRCIFPYWSFFDELAHTFEIHYKIKNSSDWRPINFQERRRTAGIFFNASINLTLAQFNIVEHFARDIQELQDGSAPVTEQKLESLTSVRLLKSLLSVKLDEIGETSKSVQFKIVALNDSEQMDIYQSDWIAL